MLKGSPIAIIETEQTSWKKIDSDYVKDLENSFSELKNDITSHLKLKMKIKLSLSLKNFSHH